MRREVAMRLLGILAPALLLAAPGARAGVSWESDLEKAKERAIREDKLLFIDFYADW
jgi:hypothetical protein